MSPVALLPCISCVHVGVKVRGFVGEGELGRVGETPGECWAVEGGAAHCAAGCGAWRGQTSCAQSATGQANPSAEQEDKVTQWPVTMAAPSKHSEYWAEGSGHSTVWMWLKPVSAPETPPCHGLNQWSQGVHKGPLVSSAWAECQHRVWVP